MEQITKLSIHSLKIHPRNQEFFDDIEGEAYEQFKRSIKEDGIITPIVVSPDMVIVSGNQRYKACVDLGIELIPAIIREELIDEDLKLRQLIAANFGRLSNDPAKMRKAIKEYVDLVGLKHGQRQDYTDRQGLPILTQEEIAKELNLSVRDLKNLLSIERNLIPELKQSLDKGFISKTAALGICSKLDSSEQQDLLTELTSLLGEKANTNPDKEKVSITNKEIQQLTEEVKLIKQEKEKLAQENTKLLTTQVKMKELKDQIDELNQKLQERPEKEIEIEVAPEDYTETKRKLQESEVYYSKIKKEHDDKVKQINELRQQINSLKSVTEEEKYAKKLKDSAIFFCARVNDFIEKTGGFVWLSEHITELPEFERKSYIKAIEMVENWATAMKMNMKTYL